MTALLLGTPAVTAQSDPAADDTKPAVDAKAGGAVNGARVGSATDTAKPAGGQPSGEGKSAPAAKTDTAAAKAATGVAATTWEPWRDALQAVLDRKADAAEAAFGRLLELSPSALRIAMLADFAVNQTSLGGGVLLLEQDLEAGALQDNGKKVADLLVEGRERLNEADDGWFFASVGRFDVADANFKSLLAASPDPVALLEFADRTRKRRELLVALADHPVVGESCRGILKLLDRGEVEIKADPIRIQENIKRLAGPPRAYENSSAALKDSGEFAIPFIIQTLRNPAARDQALPTLRALAQLGRPALNPLVYALRVPDPVVRRHVIDALGQIGYAQALPYLKALVEESTTSVEMKSAATTAIAQLRRGGFAIDANTSAAQAFFRLAEEYYADAAALAADTRLDVAHVWYWRDDLLQNVEVPTPIFNEIMAMRCCEEALRLDASSKPALALWLAANLRREAELPAGLKDDTRPENYPSGLYFAQTAGAEYGLMALGRALDRNEPAVALGLIEALKNTAGAATLLPRDGQSRATLADALAFTDRMVRIRAAIALTLAQPNAERFPQAANLVPALVEGLKLHKGEQFALLVDPDQESSNAIAAALRANGYAVRADVSLYEGLRKARAELPGVDLIVLASDMKEPRLPESFEQLRSEYRFAGVPVVVVTKPGDRDAVRALVRKDPGVADTDPQPSPEALAKAIAQVGKSSGRGVITPELGKAIALEASQCLILIGRAENKVYDLNSAESGLLGAFQTDDETLRISVAEGLGFVTTAKSQEAIAKGALNKDGTPVLRKALFAALANSAKRCGKLLSETLAQELLGVATNEPDLELREAASRAVGALSLPGKPAAEIIVSQYGG